MIIISEMPDGTNLFSEIDGCGEPVLLVPGLGAGNWLWRNTAPELSKKFTIIMPELRGSGRSDKPDKHYSIALFANDIKNLLGKLNVQKVHIIGVSMGGFVSLYFAAKWPELTQTLTIAGTPLGGEHQKGPSGQVLTRTIRPHGKNRRERLEDGYRLNFSDEFIENQPDELDLITKWRLENPQPEFAYYRQLLAGNAFDGSKYASLIKAPTLITAGKEDPIVPLEDVLALKNKIPGAVWHEFDSRHLFFFEHAKKFNKIAVAFMNQFAFKPKTNINIAV